MANEVLNMECSFIQVYGYQADKRISLGFVSSILDLDGTYDCLVTLTRGRLILYWPTGRSTEDKDKFKKDLDKLTDDCKDAGLEFECKTLNSTFSLFSKDGTEYAREI